MGMYTGTLYVAYMNALPRDVLVMKQPRPQGLLLVQNGGRRNPWPRLPKWLQKFVKILSRKHFEMSSFRLNNSFRLQKKQTGLPDAKTNLQKAVSSCVTWQNTPRLLEYFSSLGQGFLRPPFWTRRRPWGRGWWGNRTGLGTDWGCKNCGFNDVLLATRRHDSFLWPL